jgi:hypothetical protein
MTDVSAALLGSREVKLPSGGSACVRALRMADYTAMLGAFQPFLVDLAVTLGTAELTDDQIREQMPPVLLDAWHVSEEEIAALPDVTPEEAHEAAEARREAVSKLMGYFTDWPCEAVQTVDDFNALWAAIYGANRVPFGRRLRLLQMSGQLPAAVVDAKERTAALMDLLSGGLSPDSSPLDTNDGSSPHSESMKPSESSKPEPAQTDATPTSPPSSRRRRSKQP